MNAEAWRQFQLGIGIAPSGIAGLPDSILRIVNQPPKGMHWPHAVGQQVWVSLVGLATAYSTVTSIDGQLRPPVVISAGPGETARPDSNTPLLRPEVTKRLREILGKNGKFGTARTVNTTFKRRSAGGKTGTGEREGLVSDAVFAAVAPWADPQWIVIVSIKGGRAGSLAGLVAGDILNLLPFGNVAGVAPTAPIVR